MRQSCSYLLAMRRPQVVGEDCWH